MNSMAEWSVCIGIWDDGSWWLLWKAKISHFRSALRINNFSVVQVHFITFKRLQMPFNTVTGFRIIKLNGIRVQLMWKLIRKWVKFLHENRGGGDWTCDRGLRLGKAEEGQSFKLDYLSVIHSLQELKRDRQIHIFITGNLFLRNAEKTIEGASVTEILLIHNNCNFPP